MGKPKAPKPPDPAKTAAAQTGTNVSTAVANAYLGNVNQVTPDWALTYDQSGTHSWTDPSTGSTYQIPTFTAYQQLSPQQQALKDANYGAELNMANLASSQSSRLNDLLGQPISMEGLPERPGIPGYYGYSNFEGFEGLDPRYADGGNIQRKVGTTQDVRHRIGDAGEIQRGLGDAGDITRTYGTDFSEDRLRVEQALMDRMQPYLDRDYERTQSQLANQGLMLGSEGYTRGIDDYNRQTNDARLGAILGAGEEQARMVGMEANRAAFENQAQNQAFGQEYTQGQFANQAQQQAYNQELGRSAFWNQAQAQDFGQQYARGEFANAAQSQAYGQDRDNIDSSNATLQQMYQNYLGATAANNQLQDSRFNQDVSRYQMQDDARSQALQEQFAYRNQPINEITALMSGSQVSAPNFVNTGQYNIPTTDYAGLVNQGFNQQQQQYGAQMNQYNSLMGGLFGLGSSFLL